MIIVLLVFGIGVATGWFLGVHYKDQDNRTPSLEAGAPEADALREEAQKAVQGRIQKRKSRILAVVQKEGRITNDGVEDLFCISGRTAGRYLNELVSEGKLKKIGNTGRGVYYITP